MKKYVLPQWMQKAFSEMSSTDRVALLVRHSVRESIPDHSLEGFHLPITSRGFEMAGELGALIGNPLQSLNSSPFVRCCQTGGAIAVGAGKKLKVQRNFFLGLHSFVILNLKELKSLQEKEGISIERYNWVDSVVRRETLPGLMPPDFAIPFLAQHFNSQSRKPGIHLFCTHDFLISFCLAYYMGQKFSKKDAPLFMEGMIFRFTENEMEIIYRDWRSKFAIPKVDFCTRNVELFGMWLSDTFLFSCPARYVIAGGAFKTLLSGRFPSDIDIWPHSEEDRQRIITHLLKWGAIPIGRNSVYHESFRYYDSQVEISLQCKPSLERVVQNFDIPLSAVGVEHFPGEKSTWKTFVHPKGLENIANKQLQLFYPYPNPSYLLGSLERIDRYAKELELPRSPEEENRVWAFFQSQPAEVQWKMVSRYLQVSRDLSILPKIREQLRGAGLE